MKQTNVGGRKKAFYRDYRTGLISRGRYTFLELKIVQIIKADSSEK